MSRHFSRKRQLESSFPRVSGDEPSLFFGLFPFRTFSPRERG